MIPEELRKPYNPEESESTLYKLWEESGFFNPDNLPDTHTKPYCIIMPPPNANGSLHAGHAMMLTIEDVLIRYKRMRGFKTLWLPGADHAGFETQVVYEKKLEKEGRSRFQMSREELYREIMAFTMENKREMENQVRQMGASCDWSRLKFTLDEHSIKIVYDTFKKLDEDKLLYRGLRSVNWCPKHQTAFSNLELTHEDRTEPFYYFKYGPFTIGTARPETKFGDKYVVMHPDDERFSHYKHGEKIELEWINGPITATIIKDEAGDPKMGSGVMTITPWHSAIDFDIAQRHKLDYEQIIDERGKLLPIAGEFTGAPLKEARPKIVQKLKEKGLLVKIDERYQHSVPVCYKCEREIEPQLKEQWFISVKPLAEKALKAVEKGETTFVTEYYEKIFNHWLKNIEDWNISRQIVWGIPIPAKLCTECGKGTVDIDDTVRSCPCGGNVIQDPDTFDTWFSSGQWPYAALGYPLGEDFKTYYPTSVMETGSDIIFFWVARMLMLGLYRTDNVPFKKVYLHGMVRDERGRKMSKSKGNVKNPIDITRQFGTDALRMALVVGNTPGTDLALSEDKVRAYKHFANKLWNVARFILENKENTNTVAPLTKQDEALREELKEITAAVTEHIEKDRFHLAAETLYHYLWHEVADKIIEESKEIFEKGDEKIRSSRRALLSHILETTLKLLHPFMPFITEKLWGILHNDSKNLLLLAPWPK
ncbi:MAG: valine--tRNA ligase [Candidatus Paceibacterota bacterium]